MIGSMTTTGLRVGWRDVAIAVALSALGLLLMYENATDAEIDASYLAMPAYLLISVPMVWRRVAPLQVAIAVLLGLLVHIALFGSIVRCGAVYPLTFVLGFTCASLLDRRPALYGLGLTGAIAVAMAAGDDLGFGVIVLA